MLQVIGLCTVKSTKLLRRQNTCRTQAAGHSYQIAAYVVDFDGRGRRQSISVMDGETLGEISPVQYVKGDSFVGGTWLVWRYNASIRLRFNYVRGDNQVVSALMFD